MGNKRFWFSVAAVWAVMFVTDWILHGMWMGPLYQTTPELWKSQESVKGAIWAAWLGNAIFATAFVWIYSKGISQDSVWSQAFRYAIAILLVSKVPTLLGQWTYFAFPNEMIWKWGAIYFVQAFACAFTMAWAWGWSAKWEHATAGK
ncbi:MAG: hypothetical protein KDD38_02215 [Bdellovibrionales bacterium]|nr:hypothetical protein [Bdellovibrionales bacterium]